MTSETGFDPELYKRFPTRESRPEGELEALERVWEVPRGWAHIGVVSNNYIGLYFVATTFLFFLLAGVLALLMRTQLAVPMNNVLSQDTYNQVFTMHGTVMMFLFAVPAVEALAVLLLPQMLGARDLPFPRLSAFAFWAYAIGGLGFFCSIFVGLAPDGGWFMYPPLTSTTYSPGLNTDFWLLGIGFIEISAIAGAIELIVGVMRCRAPGMTLDKMPMFAWAMLVFAVMIVIGFPAVIFATTALELERAFNWPFFDPTRGGDPVLWQHLFWFFGHPEVYIIFLPAAGLMSMMVATIARARLVGYWLVVLALLATGFISFGVWAHHMFAVGMPTLSAGFFSAASMAVSVPAGVQVFAWIATLSLGRIRLSTPALFVVGSIVIFVIGGLTGVMVALVPFDWQAHDSYFIVAHLHYVLLGGMVFPMFAAFYYWTPMMSRNALSERVGKWVFGLMFTGMNVAFLPMHLTGLMGMPRRVYTYLPDRAWDLTNMISTVGAFLIAAGVLLFIVDLCRNFRFAPADGNAGNVYGGGTLEWLPSGLYSTRSIPIVNSREPLWDNPDLARDVEEGRYFLPGPVTGRRESLITSPLRAEPQYIEIMPGPSPFPFFAGLFTAGFFLLLTVKAYPASIVCGVLAVAAMLRWVWETDRPVAEESVDIGAGIRVPTYVTGPSSHGWWAMVILLIVIGMIYLMGIFSYLYLYGRGTESWVSPPASGWLLGILAGYGATAALAVVARAALARRDYGKPAAVWLLLLAATVLAGTFAADLWSWWDSGLRPEASGQGSTVYTLIALQSCQVVISGVMALFVAARGARGLITAPANNSVDVTMLFLVYSGLQGGFGAALVRLFPGGV